MANQKPDRVVSKLGVSRDAFYVVSDLPDVMVFTDTELDFIAAFFPNVFAELCLMDWSWD